MLRIEGLTTEYEKPGRSVRALDGLSLELGARQTLAVVGESGSGKTALGLSIMRLLPHPAGRIVAGRVLLNDQDLTRLPESAMRAIRGDRVSMIFQEPMTALNPVLSIERQIGEVMRTHRGSSKVEARELALDMLRMVRIPDAQRVLQGYPHQLSGGMRQRVMIAAALACQPALLIADEPTTALDVTIQAEILELIADLQSRLGTAVMFISHDLGVVSNIADRVLVLYAGHKVEEAPARELFARPLHPYTRALLAALPGTQPASGRCRRLPELPAAAAGAPAAGAGCSFAPRCRDATGQCWRQAPPLTVADSGRTVACWNWQRSYGLPAAAGKAPDDASAPMRPLLEVKDLDVEYRSRHLWRGTSVVRAVQKVSLEVGHGETLAVVGESGCGKSSMARAILGLIPHHGGRILMHDAQRRDVRQGGRGARRDVQIVFQDPFGSLNPRMRIGEAIAEPLSTFGLLPRQERGRRVRELLEQVGLQAADHRKYPHEFSGGQRQRIALARALAAEPRLIVCDEPTSALDVSIQAQILNLLAEIQERRGLAYLFISHDLALVRHFAHRVAVMYLGRIVEIGPAEEIFQRPQHPYTEALIAAAPRVGARTLPGERQRLFGEPPSPARPPPGCAFHPRCPKAIAECRVDAPMLRSLEAARLVACHVAEGTRCVPKSAAE